MKKIYTIGRDSSCDIVIQDPTDIISRLHATIRVESNKKIYITDQSRNGTFVNGIKMASNVEIPVSREDVISFAHIYNFDWNSIPKQKNNFMYIILFAVLVGIIAGGIVFFMSGRDDVKIPDVNNQNLVQTDTVATKEKIDSTVTPIIDVVEKVNKDTDKNKDKKEPEEEDESEKVEEVQEEEVIDPIY